MRKKERRKGEEKVGKSIKEEKMYGRKSVTMESCEAALQRTQGKKIDEGGRGIIEQCGSIEKS